MVVTAAYAGMRWGEIAGLHKDSLDLTAGIIRIDEKEGALHEVTAGVRRPPKPPNGARDIVMPPFLIDMLAQHQVKDPRGYVFTGAREHGGGARRSTGGSGGVLRRPGKPSRRTLGTRRLDDPDPTPLAPKLTFHGLRHSAKTWMEEDGYPRSRSARGSVTNSAVSEASTHT